MKNDYDKFATSRHDEIKRVLKNNRKVLFSVDHPMRFCCDSGEIDEVYFKRFSEIPQFMAFLATNIKV